MKTVEFCFYDPTGRGVYKTVSTPADAPFKYVVQFAADALGIEQRIKNAVTKDGAVMDRSYPASEVLLRWGCDVYFKTSIV